MHIVYCTYISSRYEDLHLVAILLPHQKLVFLAVSYASSKENKHWEIKYVANPPR